MKEVMRSTIPTQEQFEKQYQQWLSDPARRSFNVLFEELIQRQPMPLIGVKNECMSFIEEKSKELEEYLHNKYPLLYYVPRN